MRRFHALLDSPQLGRKVNLWVYGHWGPPVVAFPSAAGYAHEWEAQGMIGALAPLLEGGKLKLYCPETNVAEAWTARDRDPVWKIGRHLAYERFVMEVLVPAVRSDCQSESMPLAATGCSLGASYAALFALKQPETFRWALSLSGRYLLTVFTGGFSNLDVYLSNPLAFVPNLEGEELQRVRAHTHLTLVCGQGPWEEGCIEETQALADLCVAKQIPHERDIWGHDSAHHWDWWRKQAVHHFGRRFGG